MKRGATLTVESERLNSKLPSRLPLAQLRSAVSRAHSLEYELSELDAEIGTGAEAATAERPEGVPPRPMRWLGLAALFVALGWLTMYLLRGLGVIGVIVVLALAVGVVVALVQAVRMARRRRQYGFALQLAEAAVAQRQEQERAQQEQSRRKRRELDALLAQLGVADVQAAEALVESVQEGTEALAHIEGELRGLGIDDRSVRRLEEARDEAANETEQARHALAAMGKLAEDPAASLALARRLVAQTSPARDAARSEEDQAQGRIDANQIDAELVAELAERLAAAREREAGLQRRLLIYEDTLAAIEAAEQATLRTAARYLEERMGPTIAAVTDGRYDDIEVDEKSLAFKVRVPETGELVGVGQLSQGTADQLFLAARLGLVQLVTLERRPPLILDDPFVTFDAERAERALRLVQQFSHEHGFQVLYLTCSDRFDAFADELVVLPGPPQEHVPAVRRPPGLETETAAPFAVAAPPAVTTPWTVDASRAADAPQPTLRFEPDPRPNPDSLSAPRGEAAVRETPSRPASLLAAQADDHGVPD